jgi:hypothetical protein
MNIAQIAPLIESVPPRLYGGTERAVSYLTEELVAQGLLSSWPAIIVACEPRSSNRTFLPVL